MIFKSPSLSLNLFQNWPSIFWSTFVFVLQRYAKEISYIVTVVSLVGNALYVLSGRSGRRMVELPEEAFCDC